MKNPFLAIYLCALILLALGTARGQETVADILSEPGINLSDPASRAATSIRIRDLSENRRINAQNRAIARGLPTRITRPNGAIEEISDFDGEEPIYFTTHNAAAATSTSANLTRTTFAVDGSGIALGMWDGGSGRATHTEFGSRMIVKDGSISIDHATHVGGTLIASGVSASARGMAPAATVDSYDWNNDVSEMTSRAASAPGQADKLYLSNHSYGIISGWNNVSNGTRVWEWHGNGTSTVGFEQDFGRYHANTEGQDSLAYNAPYYLMFRSAGNERINNPSDGQLVALSPGSSTVVAYSSASHPPGDGLYRNGYETLSYEAVAKNLMTVGSTNDAVTSNVRDVSKASQSDFSSWGPTDDGRIKPDIVANGAGLYSSVNTNDTAYASYSGTSMSSPNAAGSAALLVQHYQNLFSGGAMRASTLKGLIIHTADDLGTAGPDYKNGWGLMNTQAAAAIISDHHSHPEKQRITENQLSTTLTSRTHSFVWDGSSPIRATLSWTDPAGKATLTSDLRTPRLVNNLDLKIIAPGGSSYLPFIMPFVGDWSLASMESAATTGTNITDNVEQVLIAAPPTAGTYQVVISYTGTLTNNLQNYSLLISGSSSETPPPPPLVINSISPNFSAAGIVPIRITGTNLLAETSIKLVRTGHPDIAATGIQVSDGVLTGQLTLSNNDAGLWDVLATNPNGETSTLTAAFTVSSSLWNENFDASPIGWTSTPSGWNLVTNASHTASQSYFIAAPSSKITTSLTSPAIQVPSTASNLQIKFWHSHDLQASWDGGRVEISTDNGSTWIDTGSTGSGTSFASNGYTGTILFTYPLNRNSSFAGKLAWTGNSNGFKETIINLTDSAKFAGKTMRIRWTLATNSSTASPGWYIDTVSLVGDGDLTNTPPVITTAASSSSTETVTDVDDTTYQIIRANSANLSVTANDNNGENNLSYQWTVKAGAPVYFLPNANNSAKTTSAYFEELGDYQLELVVSDAEGLSVSSQLNLRILPAATDVAITPGTLNLSVGESHPFTAKLLDQFGGDMPDHPASFTWSNTGGGTISQSGNFSATQAGGPYTVTAQNGSFSDTASVTVNPALASITFDNLTQTYDGTQKSVTATTNPPGLSTTILYNEAPTSAGEYTVTASITDPNYIGSASATLTIEKALASITLDNLTQIYDGTHKSVTLTTTPPGLSTNILYNETPIAADEYTVTASITDPNYTGSASATLTVEKALASITLDNLIQTYDGTQKSVTATTTPPGLSTTILYNESPEAPTAAGEYTVTTSITDPNYTGSASATLTVEKALASITFDNLTQTYDGTQKSVTATTNPPGLSTSILYNETPIAAGEYTVTASITDPNYIGSASATLTVEKALASITLDNLIQTYDGTQKSVTATTTPPGLSTSILYNEAPIAAGEYTVTTSITDPNYIGSASATLTVEKALASITLDNLTQTYDGTQKSVTATTTPPGLSTTILYNENPEAPTAAGEYTVNASITDPNYIGSASATLTVEKALASITFDNLTQTYDGTQKSVTATTNPPGLSTTILYSETPIAAGEYTITASITAPNYTGSASATLTVEKALASITLDNLTQTYDGTQKSVTATTNPPGLSTTILYNEAPTSAGEYTVTTSITDPNYTGSASATLTVEKALASITFDNLTQTYDGTQKSVTLTTTPPGLSTSILYNEAPIAADDYTVTASITDPNYTGSASATLTVEKALASITFDNLTQTYDGTQKSVTATTNPPGLSTSILYNETPIAAGEYTVTASITDPNYIGSASATLTVEKALASITFDNLTQIYDGTQKSVTATTNPPGLSTSILYNETPIAAGEYTVTASITDPNYTGSASATLTVEKALASITLDNLTQTYDGTQKSVTATTNPPGLSTSILYNEAPIAAGEYTVNASITDPNYIGSASATLTVEKALASITLDSLIQTYDGTQKSVTATTTPPGLSTTILYNESPEAPTAAGEYTVNANIADPNYTGFSSATLAISAAGYLQWELDHFTESQILSATSSPTADPDQDGLSNLAEYALGTQALAFTPQPSPEIDENFLSITFSRPKNRSDLTYHAETSADLAAWSPAPLEIIAESETSETLRAKVARTGESQRQFIRLRFTKP